MITKYDKTLNSILEANAGIITSAEAQEAGATRPAFSDYVRRHGLERASRGVYIDPDVFPDEMALPQKRFPCIGHRVRDTFFRDGGLRS